MKHLSKQKLNELPLAGFQATVSKELKKYFTCFYDEKSAIGRRYRRQDEAGTPFCVTVDGQTLQDKTVTVRERDSMEQIRVATDQLLSYFREKLDV